MNIDYFKETDSLYISLSTKTGVDTKILSDDIVMDIDEHGEPVGLDIQHAAEKIDIAELITNFVPAKRIAVGEHQHTLTT